MMTTSTTYTNNDCVRILSLKIQQLSFYNVHTYLLNTFERDSPMFISLSQSFTWNEVNAISYVNKLLCFPTSFYFIGLHVRNSFKKMFKNNKIVGKHFLIAFFTIIIHIFLGLQKIILKCCCRRFMFLSFCVAFVSFIKILEYFFTLLK